MRSRPRYFAALAALAAMLFAQAAFALAACDPVRGAARAAMVVQTEEVSCHQPADNANLCLAHCQGREQTLDKHQVKVPDAPLAVIQLVNAWPDAPQLGRLSPRLPAPALGPPLRILFRTLLI